MQSLYLRVSAAEQKPDLQLDGLRRYGQDALAADIARAHGGQLRLVEGERLGGLRAEIVIPR